MISLPDRQRTVKLIDTARARGARLEPACREMGICSRTYQRWKPESQLREDRRPFADRPVPANALSPAEQQLILETCHRPEFASLAPEQIVVRLLDQEPPPRLPRTRICRH